MLTHPFGVVGRTGTSTSVGKIERVLTEPTQAGDAQVTVQASEKDPRYEIRNEKTGKAAAVKEENIESVIE
ncbi:hypothetical protein BZA05DRAFT_473374 [Tricharina praecox]|uniref:uncharacterized protein n=1 Tax=Tricharina praecox TaxID=43433 RepID=UPI00221ED27F|nr:uncharacterized protein BZA05DRAFT_473374 [Tricharina praecox]KAI5854063.1 hypothetical protein BZA05DRAFT_473374 [Tricharina praecox]